MLVVIVFLAIGGVLAVRTWPRTSAGSFAALSAERIIETDLAIGLFGGLLTGVLMRSNLWMVFSSGLAAWLLVGLVW
jgi:hypothetical protein